eukprot:77126-Rhodomonas_salina.5
MTYAIILRARYGAILLAPRRVRYTICAPHLAYAVRRAVLSSRMVLPVEEGHQRDLPPPRQPHGTTIAWQYRISVP